MSREEMAELWVARINDYRASGERVASGQQLRAVIDGLAVWGATL